LGFRYDAATQSFFASEQSEQESVPERALNGLPSPHDATPDMTPDPMPDLSPAQRHHELIAEIQGAARAGRAEGRGAAHPRKPIRPSSRDAEAQGELVIIHNAISRTKQEIATLARHPDFHGESMSRMTHELDAVVAGTEQATQTILNMVEDIDQFATT